MSASGFRPEADHYFLVALKGTWQDSLVTLTLAPKVFFMDSQGTLS